MQPMAKKETSKIKMISPIVIQFPQYFNALFHFFFCQSPHASTVCTTRPTDTNLVRSHTMSSYYNKVLGTGSFLAFQPYDFVATPMVRCEWCHTNNRYSMFIKFGNKSLATASIPQGGSVLTSLLSTKTI